MGDIGRVVDAAGYYFSWGDNVLANQLGKSFGGIAFVTELSCYCCPFLYAESFTADFSS